MSEDNEAGINPPAAPLGEEAQAAQTSEPISPVEESDSPTVMVSVSPTEVTLEQPAIVEPIVAEPVEEPTPEPVAEPEPEPEPAPVVVEVKEETAPTPEPDPDAEIRAAERAARERRLGTVTPVKDDFIPAPVEKPTTDKALGSVALFLLRLVVAAVVAVRGFQIAKYSESAREILTDKFGVPYAEVVVWFVVVLAFLAAALLVLGFGTRLASIIVAIGAISVLTFLRFGPFNPLLDGIGGFSGEMELLLAVIALALALLGSGGIAVDGVRRNSQAKKRIYN